jgi:predicted RNA-binding Zn-ribbon protein involved in translation (DUF1610 family)
VVWIATVVLFAVAYLVYTLVVNRAFLRCPYCGKIGAWRFEDVGEPVAEYDDDGDLVRSATRQACTRCGGEVISCWSDHTGREIRKA